MAECLHNKIAALRTVSSRDALVPIRGRVYWHINEKFLTRDLNKHKVVLAFEKTFQAWQKYFNPIQFESTSNKKEAAIVIHFMANGNAMLPYRFDKETLAYAFFPKKKSLGIESDMYFNDAYKWGEMHSRHETNLFKVAVHEVGHAFGLDHSTNIQDIMYPTYQPNDSVVITKDTEQAVNKLYGRYKRNLAIVGTAKPPWWTYDKYFTVGEMECPCGCSWLPEQDFMEILFQVRVEAGFPFVVNSGARCPIYNDEHSDSGLNGPHTKGAADIKAAGLAARRIVELGLKYGMTGIGVKQHGEHSSRFIHLDNITGDETHPRPWIWSYE